MDKKLDLPSIEQIEESVREIAQEVSKQASLQEFHKLLQRQMVGLARKYGMKGVREYAISYKCSSTKGIQRPYLLHDKEKTLVDKRPGAIDVVWLKEGKPAVAFEIDSSRRLKSIQKLQKCAVQQRIWLYYGYKDATPRLDEFDSENLVHLVRITEARPQRKKRTADNRATSSGKITWPCETER